MVQRVLCRYGWKNEKVIFEYIRNQPQEDYMKAQLTLKEQINLFTGNENKYAKMAAA